jgi:hypothetical protein
MVGQPQPISFKSNVRRVVHRRLQTAMIALLVVLLIAPRPQTIRAAENDVALCHTAADGLFPNADVFIRYKPVTGRLALANWNVRTGDIEVSSNLRLRKFFFLSWAPGCRYFMAFVTESDGVRHFYAWDVKNKRLVGKIESNFRPFWRIEWSPDGAFALMQIREGGILWRMADDRRTVLNGIESSGRAFNLTEFDPVRGELLIFPVYAGRPELPLSTLFAYRLADGAQVGAYSVLRKGAWINYQRFGDNRYLFVTPVSTQGHTSDPMIFAVWDRDRNIALHLRTGLDAGLLSWGVRRWPSNITFSPDKRFIVINDFGANYARVYVWDQRNLLGEMPHLPNLAIPMHVGARGFRFVADHTVETVEIGDDGQSRRARRFDLASGLTLFDSDWFPPERCAAVEAGEVEHVLYGYACQITNANWDVQNTAGWGENRARFWSPNR